MSTHQFLSGYDLHEPYHFVQETDPGPVGEGKYWLQVSVGIVKRRNAANDGWGTIGGGTADYAIRDEDNTFSQQNTFNNTGNSFTQGLLVGTEAAVSGLNVSGDGDVTIGNTGNVEISNATNFNIQSIANFNNKVYVNGALILTQAVTSAQAVGIVGLTGGGATKLDGIASATAIGRIVLYYNGSGLETWMLLAEVHTEDGTQYVRPDDDATKSWIRLG